MPRQKGSAVRRVFWVFALALFSVLFAAGVSFGAEKKKAAEVDGVVILQERVDAAIQIYKLAAMNSGRGVTPGEEAKLRDEVLERLIVDQLLYAEAKKRGLKISDSDMKKALENFKERYRIKSDKEFKSFLEKRNIKLDQLKDGTKKQLMRVKLLSKTVAPKAKVSEKEAEEFYKKNKEKLFTVPRRLRISQIFLLTPSGATSSAKRNLKAELGRIRKEIEKGKSFSEMAKRYSQHPSAKEGGDLGFFSKKELSKELTRVVFSMKKGEMSRVLETPRGFHLIKVTDEEKPRIIPFDEVKVQVTRHLERMKWAKAMDELLKDLMAKAKIKRYH